MNSIINYPDIGTGIYSVPDISLILGLPNNKVRVWLNNVWDSKFILNHEKYSWGDKRAKAVSFLTLIEFYVFSKFREIGVSSQKITKAHLLLRDLLNTPYPFANSKLLTDGKEILLECNEDKIVTVDESWQYKIEQIIAPFCQSIDYTSNNIAKRYYPKGKENSVIVDPEYQFGQPIINGTNIMALQLYDMYLAEEPLDFIAELYCLSNNQVMDGINFYKAKA
jgi:uncharacterized protein (DUF433 family)